MHMYILSITCNILFYRIRHKIYKLDSNFTLWFPFQLFNLETWVLSLESLVKLETRTIQKTDDDQDDDDDEDDDEGKT